MKQYKIFTYTSKLRWVTSAIGVIYAISPEDAIWKFFGKYEFYDADEFIKVVVDGHKAKVIMIKEKEGEIWKKVSFKAM